MLNRYELNVTSNDEVTHILLRALLAKNPNEKYFRCLKGLGEGYQITFDDILEKDKEKVRELFENEDEIAVNLSNDLLKVQDDEKRFHYEVIKKVDHIDIIDDETATIQFVKKTPNSNIFLKGKDKSNNPVWLIYYINEDSKYTLSNTFNRKENGVVDSAALSQEEIEIYQNITPRFYNAQIASGGFSKIFLSKGALSLGQERTEFKDQPRIIKQLLKKDNNDDLVQMANREYKSGRKTKHIRTKPPIVIGNPADPAQVFLVMNYLKGKTLQQVLHDDNLDTDERIDLTLKFLYGLKSGLHARGIVHSDIKPGNIMINKKDTTGFKSKAFDLGISDEVGKPDKTDKGTSSYAAPEVIANEGTSIKADVYSSGLVLYEVWKARKWLSAHDNLNNADIIAKRNKDNYKIDTSDLFEGIKDLSSAHQKQIRDILAKLTSESTWFRGSIDKAIDVFENVRLERKLARFEKKTDDQIVALQKPKQIKLPDIEDDYDEEEEIEENEDSPDLAVDEETLKQIKNYQASLKAKKEFILFSNSLARELRTSLTKTNTLSEHNKLILTALDKLEKKVGKTNYDIASQQLLEKMAINEFTEVLGIKAFDQLNTIADVRNKLKTINSDYKQNVDNWRDYRKTISESRVIMSNLKENADLYLKNTSIPSILSNDLKNVNSSDNLLDKILRKGVKIENSIDDLDKFNNKSKNLFTKVKDNIDELQTPHQDMLNKKLNTLVALLPPDDDTNESKNKIKLRSIVATYLQKPTNQSQETTLINIISHLLNKSKPFKTERTETKKPIKTSQKIVRIPLDREHDQGLLIVQNPDPEIRKPIFPPTSSLIKLQQNLKTAVTNYIAENFIDNLNKGKRAASNRRLIDMHEILEIIDSAELNGDRDLKEQLSARLKKIEGFFGSGFFSRSSLRNDLLKVLDKHTYVDEIPNYTQDNTL